LWLNANKFPTNMGTLLLLNGYVRNVSEEMGVEVGVGGRRSGSDSGSGSGSDSDSGSGSASTSRSGVRMEDHTLYRFVGHEHRGVSPSTGRYGGGGGGGGRGNGRLMWYLMLLCIVNVALELWRVPPHISTYSLVASSGR